MNIYQGGCHCGAVTFNVQAETPLQVQRCNCSICAKTSFIHLIVPATQFELLSGETMLTDYRFNTGAARHLFCKRCGVKSFYVPRSNPDGYSINLNCLQLGEDTPVIEENFDGQNWEQNAGELRHLSRK